VTDPNAAAQQIALISHGLIVVLGGIGILVSALALWQSASIIGPVLLALILVIGVHPLTGVVRRRGTPMQLAATATLVTLVLVIFGLAASLALSVAQPAAHIPAHQDGFTALTNDLHGWLGSIGVDPDQMHAALNLAIDAAWFLRRPARARRQRANVVGALDSFAHGTRSYLLVSTESETSLWVQTATSDTGVTT
jgi:AI-2 transport protein TqsA